MRDGKKKRERQTENKTEIKMCSDTGEKSGYEHAVRMRKRKTKNAWGEGDRERKH